MTPDPGDPHEAEGVLNPASGRGRRTGELYLLPRMVAAGNVSRVGLAEVDRRDGVPVGVERARRACSSPTRAGSAAPTTPAWRTRGSPGSRCSALHVMTYVAYGPLGPRPALAGLDGPARAGGGWARCISATSTTLDTDLNLFPNKDVVFFPEPVPGPDGAALLRDAAPADVGPRRGSAPGRRPTCRPGSPTTGPASGSPTSPADEVERRLSRARRTSRGTGWSRCPSTTSRR